MMFLRSSLSRAGVLFLALAGIGSTGCITTAIVNNVQYRNAQRAQEAARQRRIAALAPVADAGDAKARVALADELLSGPDPSEATLRRALTLLAQAAAQDNGRAQGQLGEILAEGQVGQFGALPADLRDRERGIALLQRASTHGCSSETSGTRRGLDPAWAASLGLTAAGRPEQARVWRARAILHCRDSTPAFLLREATTPQTAPARRADSLAILLLMGDAEAIAKARQTVGAEDFAAAERLAADLQREIAASERDYPAPPRKELP
ncbi:hypothetical protein IA69_16615 [Massilia sp. JS1662]|nr:hypothetical protein IA69_16615 [Massilia sp. JS1662]